MSNQDLKIIAASILEVLRVLKSNELRFLSRLNNIVL